jgi:predicted 2-oxoglutarate/Fe(II)-dependent dioxygenase YbiX
MAPGRGERATDFVLPLEDGQKTRFYGRAGGEPTLLVFLQDGPDEPLQQLLQTLAQEGDVPTFGVHSHGERAELPFPIFGDETRAVSAAYRLDTAAASVVLVLDANLRILGSVKPSDGAGVATSVAELLAEARSEVEPLEIRCQAPVLLIDRVLDREVCEFLLQVWDNRGNEETGVEQSQGASREASIDHRNKSRQDHVVTDDKLMKMLSATIGRRVMPELQRAFAYRATRFEGFKIACYDAVTSGFFHAHRDNLSPTTAHRRFALTINLNDGYDGGHLRFPEFGPHRYRPDPGGAVVFSCSHLHEVTPVTGGRRFALLSFLFGAEESGARAQ